MASLTIQQVFALARQHHQAGRLGDAEGLYRQILAVQANHAEALHLLGAIALQIGRPHLALELISQSIASNWSNPSAHSNLGGALLAVGQVAEAIAAYRQSIQLRPDHAETYNNLGAALAAQGEIEEAAIAYSRALQLKPAFPEAHKNLADLLRTKGQLDEAIISYHRALELRPEFAEAYLDLGVTFAQQGLVEKAMAAYRQAVKIRSGYSKARNNLGTLLKEQGQLEEAIAEYRCALESSPNQPEIHYNLGVALSAQGRWAEAAMAFGDALKNRPDYPEALNNLGIALLAGDRFDEAISAYNQAIALRPAYAEAHQNLGNALKEAARFEEAHTSYRKAVELKEDFAAATLGEALLLLLRGDFERGWPLYEARWEGAGISKRDFRQPLWQGEPLDNRRILIHAEQGLGDSIQFIRYAPLVAGLGSEVIVECQPPLVALFRSVEGVSEVVMTGEPLPRFDLHVPMLSQPLVFKTTRDNIPRKVPYVFPERERSEAWERLLGSKRSRLRVGLKWAGNPKNTQSHKRDILLRELMPLFEVEDVDFLSLQLGSGPEQIRLLQNAARIFDHTEHLHDFADTAALMTELDLIISVETAVAHLAGALARPVWTLLPFIPDWRWGLDGETTPWYPTMRLFRQLKPGDWSSVIQRVRAELERVVKERSK